MTESQLEQKPWAGASELGYAVHSDYDIAHDGPNPQRSTLRDILLPRLISGQLRLSETLGELEAA